VDEAIPEDHANSGPDSSNTIEKRQNNLCVAGTKTNNTTSTLFGARGSGSTQLVGLNRIRTKAQPALLPFSDEGRPESTSHSNAASKKMAKQ
jgi:hypothetical protein